MWLQIFECARLRFIYGPDHVGDACFYLRPVPGRQNYDGDASILQVLLVSQIGISRNQDVEAVALRDIEQIPVPELLPSQLKRSCDIVGGQVASQISGHVLIEEHLHRRYVG